MLTEEQKFNDVIFKGGTAFILMNSGHVAIVDECDVCILSEYRWYPRIDKRADGSIKNVYAQGVKTENGVRVKVLMHRIIMKAPDMLLVDHKDGDGLNNTRSNLRVATVSENQWNCQLRIDNKSGVRGVSWHKQLNKWQAYIRKFGKQHHLGLFETVEEAAKAYATASEQMHGEFGRAAIKEQT